MVLIFKEWPYGDRCQELVFIGKDLEHGTIQRLLDECLLTDDEMELEPSAWQKQWYDSVDRIRLPTKLYETNLDHNVLTFDSIEDFQQMQSLVRTMKIATDADISENPEDEEEEVGEIIETTINPQRFTEFVYEPGSNI